MLRKSKISMISICLGIFWLQNYFFYFISRRTNFSTENVVRASKLIHFYYYILCLQVDIISYKEVYNPPPSQEMHFFHCVFIIYILTTPKNPRTQIGRSHIKTELQYNFFFVFLQVFLLARRNSTK